MGHGEEARGRGASAWGLERAADEARGRVVRRGARTTKPCKKTLCKNLKEILVFIIWNLEMLSHSSVQCACCPGWELDSMATVSFLFS